MLKRVFEKLIITNRFTPLAWVPNLLTKKVVYEFGGLAGLFARTPMKGHLRHFKPGEDSSPKKRRKQVARLHKMSNSNALLKRIKIVGPRRHRQFKFKPAGARHMNRNKSKRNLKRKRVPKLIAKCDIRRIKRMIPGFKSNKLKALH